MMSRIQLDSVVGVENASSFLFFCPNPPQKNKKKKRTFWRRRWRE